MSVKAKMKKKKAPRYTWAPRGPIDEFGQGLWAKGGLQCIVTARRLTITHKAHCPTESELREALNRFWTHWKGFADGKSIAEIPQSVQGIQGRIVHFFRLDLYQQPDVEITEELRGLGARVAWTADGAVPLKDNEAHARIAMVPHGKE